MFWSFLVEHILMYSGREMNLLFCFSNDPFILPFFFKRQRTDKRMNNCPLTNRQSDRSFLSIKRYFVTVFVTQTYVQNKRLIENNDAQAKCIHNWSEIDCQLSNVIFEWQNSHIHPSLSQPAISYTDSDPQHQNILQEINSLFQNLYCFYHLYIV